MAYLSTGGSMSAHQRELVRGVLAKAAGRRVEIVLAADRDEAGQKLMQEVARLAPEGTRLFSQEPSYGKDWNEQLQEHDRRRSREREREQEKVKQRSRGMDRY
ncbi:toprim domain-containing protein [Rugamonas sp. DEMB1]|uniref:toprim domain-containing protein n=1 Tax=Rugamonas sp. DEMB1 TaxID=3039386 RepID=UPI0024494866|nr:toprim domain-containing protein [Rugamonas sp. DEMB1]WGG53415.1 toprim domain-containing protein [Rugamonas sp. DEMB1]